MENQVLLDKAYEILAKHGRPDVGPAVLTYDNRVRTVGITNFPYNTVGPYRIKDQHENIIGEVNLVQKPFLTPTLRIRVRRKLPSLLRTLGIEDYDNWEYDFGSPSKNERRKEEAKLILDRLEHALSCA